MPNYLNKPISAFCLYLPLVLSTLTGLVAHAQSNSRLSKMPRVQVAQEGFAAGFADTLKAGGKPFWFEASAILFDGKSLLVAHDKPMPNEQSSVASWPNMTSFYNQQPPAYSTNPVLKKGVKYEELAQTPDRKWVFMTTAFDRVKENSTDWDGYNLLLCWPAGKPSRVQVLGGTAANSAEGTSVALREKISLALALADLTYLGVIRYFKIEGLTATADRLFVGIREEGNSFQDFKNVVRILSVSYAVLGHGNDQHIELTGNFSLLASINPNAQIDQKLPANLGLSSLEYDPLRNIFWVITSYESSNNVGSYLWTATEEELVAGKMNMARLPNNEPLVMTHKAEDMTFLNPKTLLIINDDDRIPTRVYNGIRKPNQAAYMVLSVQ